METEYAIGGFSIKREGSRFHVFCGQNRLDSFGDFKAASQLLSDLHLSKKASDDEKIGVKAFVPSAFDNGNEVIVVAKVDGGYVVQPVGTNDRVTVAEEYLSDVPELFQE
jgi:hypothetical protein